MFVRVSRASVHFDGHWFDSYGSFRRPAAFPIFEARTYAAPSMTKWPSTSAAPNADRYRKMSDVYARPLKAEIVAHESWKRISIERTYEIYTKRIQSYLQIYFIYQINNWNLRKPLSLFDTTITRVISYCPKAC